MTTTSRPDAGQTRHNPSPRKSALGALLGGKPWEPSGDSVADGRLVEAGRVADGKADAGQIPVGPIAAGQTTAGQTAVGRAAADVPSVPTEVRGVIPEVKIETPVVPKVAKVALVQPAARQKPATPVGKNTDQKNTDQFDGATPKVDQPTSGASVDDRSADQSSAGVPSAGQTSVGKTADQAHIDVSSDGQAAAQGDKSVVKQGKRLSAPASASANDASEDAVKVPAEAAAEAQAKPGRKRGFISGMFDGLRQKRRATKDEQATKAAQNYSSAVQEPASKLSGNHSTAAVKSVLPPQPGNSGSFSAATTSHDEPIPVSEDTVNFTTKHEYRKKHLHALPAPVVLESAAVDDDDESCDTNISAAAQTDAQFRDDSDEDTRPIGRDTYALQTADTRQLTVVGRDGEYRHDADTESIAVVGVQDTTRLNVGQSGAGQLGVSFAAVPRVEDENTRPMAGREEFESAACLPAADAQEEHTSVMSLPEAPGFDAAEETRGYVPLVSGPVAQARGAQNVTYRQEPSKEDDYWPQSVDYSASDTTSQFVAATETECSLGTDTTSQTTTDNILTDSGELAAAKPALFSKQGTADDDTFPVAAPRAAAVGFTPRIAGIDATDAEDAPEPTALGKLRVATDDTVRPSTSLPVTIGSEDAESDEPPVATIESAGLADAAESVTTDSPTSGRVQTIDVTAGETKTESSASGSSVATSTAQTSDKVADVAGLVAEPAVSSDVLASVDSEFTAPLEPVNRIGERLDAEADELTEDSSAVPLVGHAAILASRDRTVGAPWLPYKKLQEAAVFAPTRDMTEDDESWHDQVAELAHKFPNAYVASYWEADAEASSLPSDQALVVVRPDSVADVLHAYPLLRVASVESVTFADSCRLSFEIMRILGRDKGARWEITGMDAYSGAVHGTVYVPTGRVFNEAHRLRVLNEYRTRRQHRWPTATQDISFSINLVRTPRQASA